MKKIKNLYYLAGVTGFILSGCSKNFLERPPQDAIVSANFYKTTDQILAGTAPLYNQVWFAYNDKASHGIGDGRGGLLMSGSYERENINFKKTPIPGEVYTSWTSFFTAVAQSNSVINNIAKYAGPAV